jgi:hypothetical protein
MKILMFSGFLFIIQVSFSQQSSFVLNKLEYFERGGLSSGTALIRPDFPELLDWPYLWQQQEYVMGGGATNFMLNKICRFATDVSY